MKNFLIYCFFFVGIFAYGQNKVTGTVADEEGMALPGATIIIQNTSIGVSTDFDGNFEIEVDKGQILEFSFIGYMTQEITVGDSDTIDINLQPDNQLEEVVVTSLGFKVLKDQQGSSSSVVSTDAVVRSGEPTLLNSDRKSVV